MFVVTLTLVVSLDSVCPYVGEPASYHRVVGTPLQRTPSQSMEATPLLSSSSSSSALIKRVDGASPLASPRTGGDTDTLQVQQSPPPKDPLIRAVESDDTMLPVKLPHSGAEGGPVLLAGGEVSDTDHSGVGPVFESCDVTQTPRLPISDQTAAMAIPATRGIAAMIAPTAIGPAIVATVGATVEATLTNVGAAAEPLQSESVDTAVRSGGEKDVIDVQTPRDSTLAHYLQHTGASGEKPASDIESVGVESRTCRIRNLHLAIHPKDQKSDIETGVCAESRCFTAREICMYLFV